MNYKVSIIIPVYNAEKYLREAVESIVYQKEVGEVILIEDKSPDNALALCQKLEKELEKVILYQHIDKENHGAGASRNLGIQNAKFEYIAFLDADDYCLPNRFAKTFDTFKRFPNTDGVYEAIGTFFQSNELKQIYKGGNLTTVKVSNIEPKDLFYKMSPIGGYGAFHTDGITLKKKVLLDIGGFNTELEVSQDTNLWVKLAIKNTLRSGEVKKPVAMRRVHEYNRSRNPRKQRLYSVRVDRDWISWGVKEKIGKRKLGIFSMFYLIHRLKSFFVLSPKQFINELRDDNRVILPAILYTLLNFRWLLFFLKNRSLK